MLRNPFGLLTSELFYEIFYQLSYFTKPHKGWRKICWHCLHFSHFSFTRDFLWWVGYFYKLSTQTLTLFGIFILHILFQKNFHFPKHFGRLKFLIIGIPNQHSKFHRVCHINSASWGMQMLSITADFHHLYSLGIY